MATIFGKISEGGYIRTTPTQSPRSSRSLGAVPRPRQLEERSTPPRLPLPSSHSQCRDLHGDDQAGDADETETETSSSSRKKLPPRPPPILKKSKHASPSGPDEDRPLELLPDSPRAIGLSTNSLSSQIAPVNAGAIPAKPAQRSTKTARFDRDEVSSTTALLPKENMDKTGEDPADVHSVGKQKPARKKVGVVASTGSSKRRPVMRQRSSQSSPSSASMNLPSHLGPDPFSSERTADGSLPANAKGKGTAGQSPIFSQRASGDEAIPKRSNVERTGSIYAADKVALADPGFRSVVSTRPLPSRTSFNSILKKPTTVAAASASYQATGIMDVGQGSSGQSRGLTTTTADATVGNDSPPLSGISPPVAGSTGKVKALSRTKSQLTILLQRARGDERSSNDRQPSPR